MLSLHATSCHLHLHLLVQVQVEDTGLAIAQHIFDNGQRIALQVRGFLGQPTHPYLLSLLSDNRSIGRSRQGMLHREYGLTDISTGFPLTEILLQNGYRLVRVEVACHTDSHIVGYIPLSEIILDIGNRRVLQVVLRTDGGLCTVGVRWGQLLAQSTENLVAIVGQIEIILLIDGLQLGVEPTNHHVLETVGLNLRPVLNLVAGDILRIAGDVVGRKGVGTLSTDGCHQLVVLVGDEVLCCQLRDRVNLVVGLLTGCRVGQLAVDLVALFYLVEQGSLCSGVVGTKLLSTFEHQMLQIVGQTGSLCRVVLGTRAHSDVGLDTGLLFVNTQINLQPVV